MRRSITVTYIKSMCYFELTILEGEDKHKKKYGAKLGATGVEKETYLLAFEFCAG